MLRADFSRYCCVHTDDEPWQASPAPGVMRKRLELSGPAEAGRVTSIVRYDPGSAFHTHPHPDGEEILVLEGVFSDEQGGYRAGSWIRYPAGSQHTPRTDGGCTLYIKKDHLTGPAS